jgi:hypothetical protein
MKTLIKTALFMFAILGTATVKAQSVDDIINKHLDALGGKNVINSVKTVYIESSVDVMGSEAPSITYILNGKGYRNDLDFNGSKIIQCVTDKGGWGINPLMGQTTPADIPGDQLKSSQMNLNLGGPLMDYATKGFKVTFEGKDSADYKLKLASNDGIEIVYYINNKTYLIDKAVNRFSVNGQELETTAVFSDYKKTDAGLVLPYSQQVILPQITLNISNKKIEVNKDMDPAIFEKPKS